MRNEGWRERLLQNLPSEGWELKFHSRIIDFQQRKRGKWKENEIWVPSTFLPKEMSTYQKHHSVPDQTVKIKDFLGCPGSLSRRKINKSQLFKKKKCATLYGTLTIGLKKTKTNRAHQVTSTRKRRSFFFLNRQGKQSIPADPRSHFSFPFLSYHLVPV